MKEQLPILIELQGRDRAITDLERKSTALAASIEGSEERFAALKIQLKAAKERAFSLQSRRKELEAGAQSKEAQVKKHQGELNNLKSNDAYKAMLSEIESAKAQLSEIEDQILSTMDEQEKADAAYKEFERKIKTDEAAIRTEIDGLKAEQASFLAEAERLKGERDAFAEKVPAPLRSKYESIRRGAKGLAIVPVTASSCGGCHMSIPANKVNDVKRSHTIMFCDNCSRILYMPAPEEQEAQGEGAPQTA